MCNNVRFAKEDISIIKLFLIKVSIIKIIFYLKFNINWFKFFNAPIFAKGDISIILLFLIKHQL